MIEREKSRCAVCPDCDSRKCRDIRFWVTAQTLSNLSCSFSGLHMPWHPLSAHAESAPGSGGNERMGAASLIDRMISYMRTAVL